MIQNVESKYHFENDVDLVFEGRLKMTKSELGKKLFSINKNTKFY